MTAFVTHCKSTVATWQHPLKEIALQGTSQALGKGKPSLGRVSFPTAAVGFAMQTINPKGINYADDI
jgi:hypothetical protein